jgi:hypothetical protein
MSEKRDDISSSHLSEISTQLMSPVSTPKPMSEDRELGENGDYREIDISEGKFGVFESDKMEQRLHEALSRHQSHQSDP